MSEAERHKRIWLQHPDDADPSVGRLWCQDKVWPNEHDEHEPTEYVRADQLAAAVQAEREACAHAVEKCAHETLRQECCGQGVSDGQNPPECCGNPDLWVNAQDAALAIRARGDTAALDAALRQARDEGRIEGATVGADALAEAEARGIERAIQAVRAAPYDLIRSGPATDAEAAIRALTPSAAGEGSS